jgi:hypothetical protein
MKEKFRSCYRKLAAGNGPRADPRVWQNRSNDG